MNFNPEMMLAIEGIGGMLGGIYAPLSALLIRMLEIRNFEDLKNQIGAGKEFIKDFGDGRKMEFIRLEDGRLIPREMASLIQKTDPRFLTREQIADIQRNIMTESEWERTFQAENENIQKQQILHQSFGEFLGFAFDNPDLLNLGVQIFSLASQLNNPALFMNFLENVKARQLMQLEMMRQSSGKEEEQRKKRR